MGTVASEIQTFVKVALFWRHFLHLVKAAEYIDPAEIWCVVRDYRYTLAGQIFLTIGERLRVRVPSNITNFVKMSGFWLVFPCQATEKNQYGRNSASTVSLLYWTLVVDGGTQTPEFQSLVNVAVFRWDNRFPEA